MTFWLRIMVHTLQQMFSASLGKFFSHYFTHKERVTWPLRKIKLLRLRDGKCDDLYSRWFSKSWRSYQRVAVYVLAIPVSMNQRCASRYRCVRRSRECFSSWIVNNRSGWRRSLYSCCSINFYTVSIPWTSSRCSDSLKSSRVAITSISIWKGAVIVNESVRRFTANSSFTK